jgi:biotin operon repressor
LNANFQDFIDKRYFSFINSSSVQKPKMVHKILPHLTHAHQRTDKVALLVIDGMTYWQYLILDKTLNNIGISTKKDMTLAWLPSITKLSRQAIFRGEAPKTDYRQSPTDENRLWVDYWTSRPAPKRMQDYEIAYTHGNLTLDNNSCYRQAMVDTNLDEKMHALNSNKDLYALTKNWAEEVAEDIKTIHDQGYQIYITTDHGNVLANPWRALNSQEKTYLYERESRGNRHLIYNNADYLKSFLQSNSDIEESLLVHGEWAVWRNAKSFSNKDGITHGGAHFLEVVIPFITIKKK